MSGRSDLVCFLPVLRMSFAEPSILGRPVPLLIPDAYL